MKGKAPLYAPPGLKAYFRTLEDQFAEEFKTHKQALHLGKHYYLIADQYDHCTIIDEDTLYTNRDGIEPPQPFSFTLSTKTWQTLILKLNFRGELLSITEDFYNEALQNGQTLDYEALTDRLKTFIESLQTLPSAYFTDSPHCAVHTPWYMKGDSIDWDLCKHIGYDPLSYRPPKKPDISALTFKENPCTPPTWLQ